MAAASAAAPQLEEPAVKTRSVVVKHFGSYDVLSVEEAELPPLAGNVEVEVEYGGVNFADLYNRVGLAKTGGYPFVLGNECLGVVKRVGTGTSTDLQEGQTVICYDYKGGLYRDVVRVPPESCYPVPEGVDRKEAAAIFVNYLTAYFCLFEIGHLRPDERVLVLSCAGGVGWAATQLAKTIDGVKVFGTTSFGKGDHAMDNGVENVCTLDSLVAGGLKALCEDGKGFDLIICNVIDKTVFDLQTMLNPLGRIVLIGANNMITSDRKPGMFDLLKLWLHLVKSVPLEPLIVHNRMVAGLHLGTLAEKSRDRVCAALDHVFGLLRDEKIKPRIHSTHLLKDIVPATRVLAERRNVGKVLVSMLPFQPQPL